MFTRLMLLLLIVPAVAIADDPVKLPAKENMHLYLLIGQSNMAGRGVMKGEQKTNPRVLKFTKDYQWKIATDPLHFDKSIAGVGLGTTFGKVMAETEPQATIGLIPAAVGGTPLSRWEKGGDLWKQAVERTKRAMKDGTLKGVLWHQGESDAGSEALANSYAKRLAKMVTDLRTELDTPGLPFVAGKLGDFLRENNNGKPNYWKVVNEQIDSLSKLDKRIAVVDSAQLKAKADQVHFDTPSLQIFGQRYAKAMRELQK